MAIEIGMAIEIDTNTDVNRNRNRNTHMDVDVNRYEYRHKCRYRYGHGRSWASCFKGGSLCLAAICWCDNATTILTSSPNEVKRRVPHHHVNRKISHLSWVAKIIVLRFCGYSGFPL